MSILDSIPDISFIGDISVEKLKEIGIMNINPPCRKSQAKQLRK